MKRYVWAVNLGLILTAALLTAVLISGRSPAPRGTVFAQSTGEVGNIIAIAGQNRPRDDEPLFLIDTKDQVLVVYEYQIQTNYMSLRAARRFGYDTSESDMLFAPIGKERMVSPRVNEVQALIDKEARK